MQRAKVYNCVNQLSHIPSLFACRARMLWRFSPLAARYVLTPLVRLFKTGRVSDRCACSSFARLQVQKDGLWNRPRRFTVMRAAQTQRRFRENNNRSRFFPSERKKILSRARSESLTHCLCDTKRARDKNTPAHAESYARRPGSGGARVYFRPPLCCEKKSGSAAATFRKRERETLSEIHEIF